MKYVFNSPFADDIKSYLELRLSLGNQLETFARRLHSFDEFCIKKFSDANLLTKEIAEGWCSLLKDENPNTLNHRITVLRGFAKYLNSVSKPAYIIPNGFSCRYQTFVPHLLQDAELERFFYGADSLPPHKLSPYREYVIPVLFRVLYCCGLRPQEIRWLKRQHVNLNEGTLFIDRSKQNKDRVVAMSEDLIDLCKKYDIIMQTKLPEREYFFQNPNGPPYTANWIQQQFSKCWKKSGVSFSPGDRPRVYDFRHTYASKLITSWMVEEKNISILLPYLSTFMGHASLEQTAYYIHLIPENLQVSSQANWKCKVEVPDYED